MDDYGIDASDELSRILSQEIANQIDLEIAQVLKNYVNDYVNDKRVRRKMAIEELWMKVKE